jgi:hypothetical protein
MLFHDILQEIQRYRDYVVLWAYTYRGADDEIVSRETRLIQIQALMRDEPLAIDTFSFLLGYEASQPADSGPSM